MVFDRDRCSKLLEKSKIDVLLTTSRKNFEYFTDFSLHIPGSIYEFEYGDFPNLYFVAVPMEKMVEPFSVCCGGNDTEMTFEDSPIKDRRFYPWPRGALFSKATRYSRDPYEAILKAMTERGLENSRIGLEASYESMTTGIPPQEVFDRLRKALPKAKFTCGSRIIRQLRIIKSEKEIARMKRAAQVAENAINAAFESAHIGIKELELEKVIVNMIVDEAVMDKYESLRFLWSHINFYPSKFKLTGGLHVNVPTENKLERGDVIRVDLGCSYKLYLSDMCRTFCLEKPDSRVEKYYEASLDAHMAVANEARAGVKCSELYNIFYRSIKDKTGMEPTNPYYAGHGLGITVHEAPYLTEDDQTLLEPGMTITNETTLFVKGLGSFSVEDEMVVTKNGYDPITTLTNELNYQTCKVKPFL
jgi:Xaa-Pro aminopeptidase